MKNIFFMQSIIGTLGIASSGDCITNIFFEGAAINLSEYKEEKTAVIERCVLQLSEYFSGSRKSFDLPLKYNGTDFQKKCWKALCSVEYGKTACYSDIASLVGSSKAVRAVGGANNKNPIPIVIPCHRIIGKNGSLTGFAGGLNVKKLLLSLEKNNV